jgi:2-alkyl-3-oxoalkanoate reductase
VTVVAVTGAAGWIGSRVADALEQRDVLVRRVDLRPGPGITHGDVTSRAGWEQILDGVDTVVHLAAVVGELGEPRDYWRVNVGGTRNVAEAAAAVGVARFVHISSVVVYGPRFPDGLDETAPVRASGAPYTDSKIVSEHTALDVGASSGLDVTIVRPGDVYGPGSEQWTIRQIDLLRRRMLALPDGGRGIITPIFIDDVVSGIVAAGTHPEAGGEILNIMGSQGVTYRDFVEFYAETLGAYVPSVPTGAAEWIGTFLHAAYRTAGRRPPVAPESVEYVTHRGAPSIAKAERLLGWRPIVALEEGMTRTIAWCRDEGLLPCR